jgi:hypothetical protein
LAISPGKQIWVLRNKIEYCSGSTKRSTEKKQVYNYPVWLFRVESREASVRELPTCFTITEKQKYDRQASATGKAILAVDKAGEPTGGIDFL